MRLSQLVAAHPHRLFGAGDPDVLAITHDSRAARAGTLFAAFPGLESDGRRYIGDALARGAVAVIGPGEPPDDLPLPYVAVACPRHAAATLAARLAGDPAERLVMAGITGTSGKTTTSVLLDRILRDAFGSVGLFGTLGYRDGDGRRLPAARTTPEATDLQPMLAALVHAGARAAVMECSSHAIDLHRLAGCRFDVLAFTNLSRDHLDYHKNLDAYFEAKAALFATLKPAGFAVINADDPYGARLRARLPSGRVLAFSLRGRDDVDIHATAALATDATRVHIRGHPHVAFTITSPLIGAPNAENLTTAATAALALGVPPDFITASLAAVDRVPGRFERIENALGITVLVDYAHKPGALDGVLRAARACIAPRGRLVAVFGCGGDRDRGKRPEMGAIAAQLADAVVLTSDNPRSEDPDAILAAIDAGVREAGGRAEVIPDRAAAIDAALRHAAPGDVVVIAGKGHETYQEAAGRREPFDDREVARAVLAALARERTAAAHAP